ncbi:MAG: glutamyl-tRNA reductase [Blastocatellia bacterium]|nr:glutamyl-tRNA reductase [Blastocatellia bacterium]
MNLILVGLNHKTAPVEVRERLAFPQSIVSDALKHLVNRTHIEEAMIVSTCNRVEVLAKAEVNPVEARIIVTDFLHSYHSLPQTEVVPHLYVHEEHHAVRHLFRVASSLDSMVVGEPQILGQVKDAYAEAVKAGTVGRCLHRLLARAFSVAKRVRTETGIASFAVSMSYVAVELSKKIFEDLRQKTALLIGAGEMAELAAKHLLAAGVKKILVANRTLGNAEALASELGHGEGFALERLPERLHEADIVIVSTGATHYIINPVLARKAMELRRNRTMLFVDLSVPRNVDPIVADFDNLFVFDVDDLQNAAAANLRERQREAQRAEGIIDAETAQFITSFKQADIGPLIGLLKQRLNQMALAEFERHRRQLGELSPEQEETIKHLLLGSVVNKFLHPVIIELRETAHQEDHRIDICRAFEVEEKD